MITVEGPLFESGLGELTDSPRLSLVPALDDDEPDEPRRADRRCGPTGCPGGPCAPGDESDDDPGALIDRTVPAGTTLEELVAVIHEELAMARGRAGQEPDGTVFRTLAEHAGHRGHVGQGR